MPSGTDLIGAFRAYAQKALGSDFNPEKAAAAVNAWVKESGDALKERIERETERAVKKLGLVKQSDLRALADEVAQLRRALGLTKGAAKKSSAAKKSKPKPSSPGVSKTGKVKKSGAKSAGARQKARQVKGANKARSAQKRTSR